MTAVFFFSLFVKIVHSIPPATLELTEIVYLRRKRRQRGRGSLVRDKCGIYWLEGASCGLAVGGPNHPDGASLSCSCAAVTYCMLATCLGQYRRPPLGPGHQLHQGASKEGAGYPPPQVDPESEKLSLRVMYVPSLAWRDTFSEVRLSPLTPVRSSRAPNYRHLHLHLHLHLGRGRRCHLGFDTRQDV